MLRQSGFIGLGPGKVLLGLGCYGGDILFSRSEEGLLLSVFKLCILLFLQVLVGSLMGSVKGSSLFCKSSLGLEHWLRDWGFGV